MNNRKCLILLLLTIICSCNTKIIVQTTHFQVNDAFYQSWTVSENEKGTDIVLKLSTVDKCIVFDSLVFRGVQMPVSVSFENEYVILKSVLHVGISRLKTSNTIVKKPDQLLYKCLEARQSYSLNGMRREKNKYLRF